MIPPGSVRSPSVSGSFYSSDPKKLTGDIRKKLASANPPPALLAGKRPFAYLVPHAGHMYSGRTAAFAFNVLKAHPVSTVILLGPSHHVFVSGSCTVADGSFETPLGSVPIHKDIASFLLKKNRLSLNQEAHLAEHSLEVQLPFLQNVLPDGFRIVPILTGENSLSHIERLSGLLLEVFDGFPDESFAVVASTDLSRFHTAEAAERMDRRFLDLLAGFRLTELIQGLNENRIEACGTGSILTALFLARTLERTEVTILDRTDSSTASHDKKRVVGYFSAVIR
jgi:AmmeMemoRadiSam system protein B